MVPRPCSVGTLMANADEFRGQQDWYRHKDTGEAAIKVTDGGREYMRYHRTEQVIQVPFRPEEWIPDVERRPFTTVAVARVAHAADQELCRGLGLLRLSRMTWDDLTEQGRADRIERVPLPAPGIRAKLQEAVWDLLEDFTRS